MEPEEIFAAQRKLAGPGQGRTLEERRSALLVLREAILKHEDDLLEALAEDLGKPPLEAWTSEIHMVMTEIRHARRHLRKWMKPRRAKSPILAWPARSHVKREAAGVVLVIGPWNYPVQLTLGPLVAALAGGNRVIVKPSELAPATSRAIAKLLGEVFESSMVGVVEGESSVAERLLDLPFDHIFFTGGTATGKKVMTAAARHLTPVTLELGGKCPAVVCGDVGDSLETVARRIVWGKFLNAGQTCVAPDHVWVQESLHDPLVAALQQAVTDFYDGKPTGKIISDAHFQRVRRFLNDGRVVCGGSSDETTLTITPAILTGVGVESDVMREEIFGPMLPVLKFRQMEEVTDWLRGMPVPLAVYAFTQDRAMQDHFVAATRSGGVCLNDTVLHITGSDLPFGGVGDSGMGRYHGKAGFDTFTRERPVVRRGLGWDPEFRYPSGMPPFGKVRKWLPFLPG